MVSPLLGSYLVLFVNHKGANGDWNQYFTAIAQGLVNYNLSNAILRIGWEFNGNWYPWSIMYAPSEWPLYFQQIVTATRAIKGFVSSVFASLCSV